METVGPITLEVNGFVTDLTRKYVQFSTKETGPAMSLKDIKGLQCGDRIYVRSYMAFDYGTITSIKRPQKWDGSIKIQARGKLLRSGGRIYTEDLDEDDSVLLGC